ncbi:MAG: hypothetical protein AseanaTS_01580 [Candidatus Pelagadaptatus aseana]
MLPLLAWAATGVIFLTKPDYDQAYERLPVKTYPMESKVQFIPGEKWQEIKLVRSVLGLHLLAKNNEGFRQYDPVTRLPAAAPTTQQVSALIGDALHSNPERYGTIERVDGFTAYTSTGVVITLNWNTLSLNQRGRDREVIETLYHIHYLQWTQWEGVNLALGILGLIGLLSLTLLGLSTYLARGRSSA